MSLQIYVFLPTMLPIFKSPPIWGDKKGRMDLDHGNKEGGQEIRTVEKRVHWLQQDPTAFENPLATTQLDMTDLLRPHDIDRQRQNTTWRVREIYILKTLLVCYI